MSLTEQSNSDETITIEFDISWENSWRNAINYDAAWVFVKYSTDSGSNWYHATLYNSDSLAVNPTGWSIGSGTPIEFIVDSATNQGCFVQRSFPGEGTLDVNDVQIIWDWNADGLSSTDAVHVEVYAVEMVYIPTGTYCLGDGDGYNESTAAFHYAGTNNTYYVVSTDLTALAAVDFIFGNGDDAQLQNPGVGIDADGGLDVDGDLVVDNPLFPTGYGAFYMMKYEITQGQYADFLNNLTDVQAAARYPENYGNNRHTITFDSVYTADRPERACNYLFWSDVAAFCDWSAQRPMTELEFEKAARGEDVTPIYSEYAWGSTAISYAVTISGTEDGTETITAPDNANACYYGITFQGGDGGTGPLRAGIFAGSASNRSQSGAGYYGVMELSGNIYEFCVSLENEQTRAFEGSHGDGELMTSGTYIANATNSDWPGYYSGTGVISVDARRRGGTWGDTTLGRLTTSSRYVYTGGSTSDRQSVRGGRCVRSDPRYSYP